jgi:putative ABC transport system permease protein
MQKNTLKLIRGEEKMRKIKTKTLKKENAYTFVKSLQLNTRRSRFSLVFLAFFSAFCFSCMGQMAISMATLSTEMMAIMMLIIGLALGFLTLFIGLSTIYTQNFKTIAMLKVFGYSKQLCNKMILSPYRPIAYLGFAIGTAYQFGLLKMMVTVFYSSQEIVDIPEYNFDVPAFFIVLIGFIIIYEAAMLFYARKIQKIPLKQIMLDT